MRSNHKFIELSVDNGLEENKLDDLSEDQSIWQENNQQMIDYSNNYDNEQLVSDVIKADKLSDEEFQRIVYEFNATDKYFPVDKTIHQLFEEQVVKTPDNIAIVYENTKLTYRELNTRSNQLAHYLRGNYQIQSDDLIALCVERSEYMLIAILAVLKSGGAYVPIDPSYPEARIKYILSDTKAKVVITNMSSYGVVIRGSNIAVLSIDSTDFNQQLQQYSSANLDPIAKSNNLAYVMYTSGTTGTPKGVMIEHQNVTCTVLGAISHRQVEETSRIYQGISYAFDSSILEIFPTLCSGATLYIIGDMARLDLIQILKFINKHNLTHVFLTTKLGEEVLRNPQVACKLKVLIVAGELLNFNGKFKNLINEYGPTEATVCTTYINYQDSISGSIIGKPVANKKVYILDDVMNPVSQGEIGELYIGGAGVARGYLNQPELTTTKFIPNPFQIELDKIQNKNSRLYKTGDRVRMLLDGNLEYIDRNDFQINIRGYRIEASEIENTLNKYNGIKQSVVIDNKDKHLVAYYVAKTVLDEKEILSYLASQLPKYMLPNLLVHLEKLPLTINGKLDRAALPKPQFISNKKYESPTNELEKQVCKVFADVLGMAEVQVGIKDDFFNLGGSSILAIRLINQLNHTLGVNVELASLLKHRNVHDLVANIENIDQDLQASSRLLKEPNLKPEEYKLSFAQERLWFIHKLSEGNAAYNTPLVFKVNPKLDKSSLFTSIKDLVCRHEILRTLIKEDESGNTYQQVMPPNFYISQTRILDNDMLHKYMKRDLKYVFDLSKETPIKVNYYTYKDNAYLSIVIHHIATDGWSTDILMRDLTAYYNYHEQLRNNEPAKLNLPKLTIQYKDFALWQRGYLTDECLENQLTYWKNKLADYEILNLPTDHQRPLHFDYGGETLLFELSIGLSSDLRRVARELNVSLYSLLLSGFYLMLHAYSNQDDIVVGGVVSNRNHPQLEDLVGFFVNTIVLRKQLDYNVSAIDYVKQIGAEVIDAQLNQDVPFERLVEELVIDKDASRHPIFQVMFGVQHFGTACHPHQDCHSREGTLASGNPLNYNIHDLFTLYPCEDLLSTAKFDLSLIIDDGKEQLTGIFEYATSLFVENTIKGYVETYQVILEQMAQITAKENNEQRVRDIKYISPETYQKLVVDYNKTEMPYPEDKTIHQLFEEQIEKTPDNIAIVFEDIKLTYYELNVRSNQLAHYLRNNYQIKPDDLIALCLERSEYMLIAIIAVLKSGAAYVPIDPSYPEARIKYILSDTKAKVIINNLSSSDLIRGSSIVVLSIDRDEFEQQLQQQSSTNPDPIVKSNNLAYVMYTSGTTGDPKGVMVEHKGAINTILNLKGIYDFTLRDRRVTAFCAYVFDVSVSEFFVTLFNGGELYILNEGLRHDCSELANYLLKEKINYIYLPPVLLANLPKQEYPDLKVVIYAGEPCDKNTIEFWLLNKRIYNYYGPTEASIYSTGLQLKSIDHGCLIGKPISNVSVYSLNMQLNIKPLGAVGELFIGGDGVARGYLNQTELAKEKFIANPFQSEEEKVQNKNVILYKTGDLVKMLPDGNLEYIGRDDLQVRVNGYRIELGEIENTLNSYKSIKKSVVLSGDYTNNGDSKYLVAYCVKSSNAPDNRQKAHIMNWQNLHNVTYSNLDMQDYKEDFVGWISSYTGKPIDTKDMSEWRDETVSKINNLSPENILEVGSGNGLLLFSLIDSCKYYYAIDFSGQAIDYTKRMINNYGYQNKVKIFECDASTIPFENLTNNYDTVVINSVTQYFPSVDYLSDTLIQIINNMSKAGQIFIGDLRDFRLIDCFYYSVLKFKNQIVSKIEIDYFKSQDSELFISPVYFINLQKTNPKISHIELLPKLYNVINEISCFRYDVILHINKPSCYDKIVNFNSFIIVLDIKNYLINHNQDDLYIKYPNMKIAVDYVEYQLIWGETCSLDIENSKNLLSLDALSKVFAENGYNAKFHIDVLDPLYINIIAHKKGTTIQTIMVEYDNSLYESEINISNNPIHNTKLIDYQYINELKAHLESKLPSYMIPPYFVVLDKLPLTINGKLDKKALPAPELSDYGIYVPPSNEIEDNLCKIFSDLLGLTVDKISIKDDFFRFGGSSALSIKLINRINNSFGCHLKIADIFIYKTVEELTKIILMKKNEFECTGKLNMNINKSNFIDKSINSDNLESVISDETYDSKLPYSNNLNYCMSVNDKKGYEVYHEIK